MSEIKTTERGWAGHFICAHLCHFRRNTLIEYKDIKIVVSTVGSMYSNDGYIPVGALRYYETMAFHSDTSDDKYHDIDVKKEIYLDCKCHIEYIDENTDNEANEMHDNAVKWVCEQLIKGKKL